MGLGYLLVVHKFLKEVPEKVQCLLLTASVKGYEMSCYEAPVQAKLWAETNQL
jgi:hypothetical protein